MARAELTARGETSATADRPRATQPTEAPLAFEAVRGPGFNWLNVVLALALGGVFVISAQGTRFSLTEPFTPNNVKSVTRFVAGLFPPELAPDFLRSVGGLLLETVEISVVGTALAIVLAVPLTLLAMRVRGEEGSRAALGTPRWLVRWGLYSLARSILNLARAVPELVWALIFVVAVGLGPFPGALALAIHSAGILGKLWAEFLESVDQRVVEAVRATGAGETAATLLARVPLALPVLLSYALFRWECNMRAATVLGFVGAGGIGTQPSISMKLFRYNEVLTLAIAILLLVTLVDVVGGIVRARVLDAPTINSDSPTERQGLARRAAAFFGRAES